MTDRDSHGTFQPLAIPPPLQTKGTPMPETTSTPQPDDSTIETVARGLYVKAVHRSHSYDEAFALKLWEAASNEVRNNWRAIARDSHAAWQKHGAT